MSESMVGILNHDMDTDDSPLAIELPPNLEAREVAESESILFCENHSPKIPLVSLLNLRGCDQNNSCCAKSIYQAICPVCGSKTLKKRVCKIAAQAIPPFIMVSLDTNGELTLIKLRKR